MVVSWSAFIFLGPLLFSTPPARPSSWPCPSCAVVGDRYGPPSPLFRSDSEYVSTPVEQKVDFQFTTLWFNHPSPWDLSKCVLWPIQAIVSRVVLMGQQPSDLHALFRSLSFVIYQFTIGGTEMSVSGYIRL